jgi:hypothetical protein
MTGATGVATLLSVNVGMPRDVAWQDRTVRTGAWKQPVNGPVMVRRLNVDGDGQGDLAGHGGEQRAVLVYQRATRSSRRRPARVNCRSRPRTHCCTSRIAIRRGYGGRSTFPR